VNDVDGPVLRTIPVDGAELCVATWGSGPVVLGLHGITASSVSLAPVARELATTHTFVAPDLRGRGGSSAAPGPYGMAAHAADCAALIEAVADGPVVVVGHSMGAFVTVVLAATRPDLVERVVLVDGGLPIPIPADIDVDAVMEALLGPSLARLRMTFESLDAYFDYWRVHPALARDWNADVEAYLAYDVEGEPPELRSRVSDNAVRADGRDTLANVSLIVDSAAALTCPVHLIRAPRNLMDEPAPLLPDALVEHWHTVLPQLTSEIVDDLNHYTLAFNPRGARVIAAACR
jgi:pimeloyl-ACP methyl ester carboxylesterase